MTSRHDLRMSRKTITFSHPGVRGEVYTPSFSVSPFPTTRQATPDFTYTLQASDFPTSPDCNLAELARFNMCLLVGGQNTGAESDSATIWIELNDVNVALNTVSPSAGGYYTLVGLVPFVKPGDVIKGYLYTYGGENSLNATYRSFIIYPVCFGHNLKLGTLITDIKVTYGSVTHYWDCTMQAGTNGVFSNLQTRLYNWPNGKPLSYPSVMIMFGGRVIPFATVQYYSDGTREANAFMRWDTGDATAMFSNTTSATTMPYAYGIPYPLAKVEYTQTDVVLQPVYYT